MFKLCQVSFFVPSELLGLLGIIRRRPNFPDMFILFFFEHLHYLPICSFGTWDTTDVISGHFVVTTDSYRLLHAIHQ